MGSQGAPGHHRISRARAREATTIHEILQAVAQLALDPDTGRRVVQVVTATAAMNGIELERPADRVDYARRLLGAKVSRASIRNRLMSRFEISRTHAYRIIEAALCCPNSTP